MADTLNKLSNYVTSDTANLTNLSFTNTNFTEQLKVLPHQNKVLTELLIINICGVTETKSENQNKNKWKLTDKKRGCDNLTSTE